MHLFKVRYIPYIFNFLTFEQRVFQCRTIIMTNTKIILSDTLYITMKVIDRSLLQNPGVYAPFEYDLNNVKEHIRDVLDMLDMVDEGENRKDG